MPSVDWNAALRQYLKLDAASDATLGALLATLGGACQSAVETQIGRTFDVRGYTEYYDGNGKPDLFLNWDPIVTVPSLSVDGQAVTIGDPLAPTYPPAACVVMSNKAGLSLTDGSLFFRGFSNVLVTYTAGLADPDLLVPPPELVFAVTYWAGMLFKDRDRLGISSNIVGQQTTTFTRVIPDAVKLMIAGWRRPLKPTC